MSRTDVTWSIRPLDDSDLDEYASIAGESLLGSTRQGWDSYFDRVGRENLRGVFTDGRLAGGLGFYRMGQWFGGRCLAAAGISGVAINPAVRGQGAARALLSAVLNELHAEGMAVASLFASTQQLYRSVDFERAGTRQQYRLPLRSIPGGSAAVEVQRMASPDFDVLQEVARERARRGQGNLDRSPGLWRRLTEPHEAASVCYLFGSRDAPQGYAILRSGVRATSLPQPLEVLDMAALTPAATRRLWAFLASHSALHDVVHWYGPPADPLAALVDGSWIEVRLHQSWMIRLVHLPATLQTRGYPPGLEVRLDLEVEDPLLPANRGRWQLLVSGGGGTVVPGGDGHLKVPVRALSPLVSSCWSATQLAELGWLHCSSSEQLSLADQVFSGPAPWMPDAF